MSAEPKEIAEQLAWRSDQLGALARAWQADQERIEALERKIEELRPDEISVTNWRADTPEPK